MRFGKARGLTDTVLKGKQVHARRTEIRIGFNILVSSVVKLVHCIILCPIFDQDDALSLTRSLLFA